MTDIQAQDCELEYWSQQAEDYALVQIPCEDLRAIITRAWEAPAFNSALTAAEARAEAAEARVGELEEALKPLAPTPEVIHAIRECLDTDQFFLTGGGWEIGPVTAGDLRRLSTLKGAPDGR